VQVVAHWVRRRPRRLPPEAAERTCRPQGRRPLCLLVALALGCTSAPDGDVDLILTNGRIYTLEAAQPWVEAVAIAGGEFTFLGSTTEALERRGPSTEVRDLEGRMAMPGIYDAHVHPVLGGAEVLLQCLFPPIAGPAEIEETLSACVAADPAAAWIEGGRWTSNFFVEHDSDSPREWLDRFSGEVAISLADDTGHNRWVNSKALELAGIEGGTVVEGGEVVLDEATGEPNGLLLEAAMYPVFQAIPDKTAEQFLRAARESIRTANRFGIVGIKEAGDAGTGVAAYKVLADEGVLTVHMAASIAIPLVAGTLDLDVDALERLREENRAANLDADRVKIFLDGVPSVARTAAMLDDYEPEEPGGPAHNGGLLVPPEALNVWLQQLDAVGVTVNIHTAGDRAVRVALDAVEFAREQNGDSGLMHQLAHSGFVAVEDVPRYAELGAVADMSPAIWYPSLISDSIRAAIGDRSDRSWPVRELLDAGAHVIVGSDWPAVIPDMNPWPGMEALVTRADPWGGYPGTLAPEQAVSLEQAIELYTLAGARLLGVESRAGTIAAGKSADLIVLDRDLFDVPIEDVSDTSVELTLYAGAIVHEN